MDEPLTNVANTTALDKRAPAFSQETVMLSEPKGPRAEAIRTLRTHIMAQHIDGGRRGLAVCGASSGVGATFVAVNLSIAFAQVGVKVLLVDGDLRYGGIDKYIRDVREARGLRQFLSDTDAQVGPAVHQDLIPNLSVMLSGGTGLDAQELLAGDRFDEFLKRSLRDYDLTIVDTPPANKCADARRISTLTGYSLIVARRHNSFINDIKTLANQLRDDRAQVIGTVLNEA